MAVTQDNTVLEIGGQTFQLHNWQYYQTQSDKSGVNRPSYYFHLEGSFDTIRTLAKTANQTFVVVSTTSGQSSRNDISGYCKIFAQISENGDNTVELIMSTYTDLEVTQMALDSALGANNGGNNNE